MSAEHQYFYEDEVFRINKKGVIEFGMVLENSELVSSDDDSDVEDSGKMKKGHIRVAWHPTGEEEVLPEKKVGLADRSLMPGDVVRRMIKGKDTQRGYCRDIKVTACLQVLGTKRVIMNVKSEDLVPLEEFASDIAVCLDSWVGGIKMAQSKLMLQFSDGSRCKVTDPEAFGFDVFDEKRDSGCEFPHRGDYYPGQVLWGPLHTLQDAQWLNCSKELHSMLSRPNKTVKVMVESLETKSVTVHWQCRAYSKDGEGGGGGGENKEQPTAVVCGDKLKQMKLLNVFEPCTLQVGDRNMYTLQESDQVTSKEQWRKAQKEAVVSSLFSAVEPATYRPPLTPHYAPKRRHKRQAQGNRQQHAKFHDTHDDRVSSNNSTTALSNPNSQASVVIDSNTTQTNKSEDKVATNCDKVTSESTTQQPKQAKEEEKKEVNIPSANPNQTCDKTDKTDCDEITNSSKPGDATVTPVVTFSAHNLIKGGDEWETDSGGSDVDYMSDTCSSSTASSSAGSTVGGRGLAQRKALALMTKMLKKKSLRRARKKLPPVVLLPGTKLAVETLSTASSADVVWQDGSVEYGIPSTQLYPIHHLDDQEFFPGDFVIENHEDHSCMRVYGVVQSVDHAGRTARVNWFKTYASADDPKPTLLQKSEVSVYDLKDHPDFQYRPGTVVIRVANFEGEDANCTAGQVLDNYPEGRVRVWWVDGHISMCWPQDLYKVGEYDSDEDELWDDSSSEASWETESEVYCIADEFINVTEETDADNLKPKLAANIEKARIAMSRLEEIFTHNPALQTNDVMRKLLEVYKDCRYLDKLMGTSFFHESHFQGLLERVRERGRANVAQRVADQVSRLFNQPDSQSDKPVNHLSTGFETETQMSERSSNSDSGVVDGSPPNNRDMMGEFLSDNLAELEERVVTCAKNSIHNSRNTRINKSQQSIKSQLINQSACDKKIIDETVGEGETLARAVDTSDREAAMAPKTDADKSPATELTADKSPATKLEAEKSPVDSTTDSNTGCEVAERLGCATSVDDQQPQPAVTDADETLVASSGDLQTPTVKNSHVCVRLCSLILAQLVKAHTEVMRRYGGNTTGGMTLSDAANTVSPAGSSERDAADPPQTPEALAADASVAEPVAGVTEDCNMPAVATVNGTADDTPGTATLSPCTTPVKESEPVLSQSSCTNLQREDEGFSIMETAPNSHKFKLTMFLPNEPKAFFKTVRDEIRLLRTSLPQGIWVKGFEDRMDLYSVMIRGPEKTPYEDGLFLFDFQLSADYPKAPPLCHYVSYCSDRLNPNLYEDGKVCVSLLGTWSGKGTEVWTPKSNLLQVIVSIQGLILVSEPYFNEAGYEKQKGSQQGRENSRMYNEMVVLKLVQSMTKLINHPPPIFKEQITEHFTKKAPKMISRLNSWLEVSERYNDSHPLSPTTPNSFKEIHTTNEAIPLPEFPLIPASKGFCLTLRKSLATFTETLKLQSLNEAERRNSTTTEVDNCS